MAAIGSYNGREIYVQNTDKQLGTITTTMPIRNITVAETGRVTAILADTDVTWIMTYEADGSNSYTGQAHMTDGGYPISISLSPERRAAGGQLPVYRCRSGEIQRGIL